MTKLETKLAGNLVLTRALHRGVQHLFRVKGSDIGMSAVCHSGSYGGEAGLFEVVGVRFEGKSDRFQLYYGTTALGNDVTGWLTPEEVVALFEELVEEIGETK